MKTNQKVQNTDMLKEKVLQAAQIDTVFHVDLRMDNLKGFLSNITNILNQQSVAINTLQREIKTKITAERVENALKIISTSIDLNDAEILKKSAALVDSPKPENTGDTILDGAHQICNKIIYLGHAIGINSRTIRNWEEKQNQMANEISIKIGRNYVKEKTRKIKAKINTDIHDFKQKIQKKMDENEKTSSKEKGQIEVQIKNLEKSTLWKITDCESLLQKRVTLDYTDSSLKALEEKLRREIEQIQEASFSNLNNQIAEINNKSKIQDDLQQDKIKSLKKLIKDQEDDLIKKLCSNEKIDTYKKAVSDKFGEVDSKMTLLDRRGSAIEVSENLTKLLQELEEKLFSLQREDANIKNSVQDLGVKIEMLGLNQNKDEEDDSKEKDTHKLCGLSSEFKKQKDELNQQKRTQTSFEQEMRKKFENLEQKLLGSFNTVNLAMNKNIQQNSDSDQINYREYKEREREFRERERERENRENEMRQTFASKDEVAKLIERAKQLSDEKFNQHGIQIDDIRGKLTQINELDKKMKKKFKEISSDQKTTEFTQKLQLKADVDETKKEFELTDEKIRSLAEIVDQFRREFETIEEFYIQLANLLQTNQQEAISVLTGNSKIVPNRCGACGTKGRQQLQNDSMKGTDGKMYKCDIASNNQKNIQEVFDVLPSQLGLPTANEKSRFAQSNKIQTPSRPLTAFMDNINEEIHSIIGSIKECREKLYSMIDSLKNPNNSPIAASEKLRNEQEFNSTCSYHDDIQFLMIKVEQMQKFPTTQQQVKDLSTSFWKLYLKFSLLNGNRLQRLLIKSKNFSYHKNDELCKNKDFLIRYFADTLSVQQQNIGNDSLVTDQTQENSH